MQNFLLFQSWCLVAPGLVLVDLLSGFHLLGGFSSVEELKDVMYIPWGGTRTLPQGCTIVSLLFLRKVSASPPFPYEQLFEPALWNSRKVMEAEWGPIPTNKKWGTKKTLCSGAPYDPAWLQNFFYVDCAKPWLFLKSSPKTSCLSYI